MVAEDVWWPEISEEAVAQLQELRSAIASDEAKYRSTLPQLLADKGGQLVIHHTIPILAQPTGASYDVNDGHQVRRFDLSGAEIVGPVSPVVGLRVNKR